MTSIAGVPSTSVAGDGGSPPSLLLRLLIRAAAASGGQHHAPGLHQPQRRLAVHLLDLLFQVADAGLGAVLVNQAPQSAVGERYGAGGHSRVGARRGLEVSSSDGFLFFPVVPRDTDHLHAVQQRARNRLEDVGGADKEDAGEVEGHVEVVIEERRFSIFLNVFFL